jgi:hypothetical protein
MSNEKFFQCENFSNEFLGFEKIAWNFMKGQSRAAVAKIPILKQQP